MTWKKRTKYYGLYKNYSIINKFSKEDKLNKQVLNSINNLSLEDLIAIKLELSTRALGGKYYGIPLWHSLRAITSEAVLKTAVSVCRSKKESSKFLGIDYTDFRKLIKKFDIESFFENERNGDETVSTEDGTD
tara:strand:+ start:2150 stop:2548 length:399 start_codon:yes stop_codon:yes gene_type:complete